jgi:hypothetical protein
MNRRHYRTPAQTIARCERLLARRLSFARWGIVFGRLIRAEWKARFRAEVAHGLELP